MRDTLCGKRGKFSFVETPWIDTSDSAASCPQGTTPCSKDAESGLTYCVDQSKETCPITEIAVVDASSSQASDYINHGEWETATSSAPVGADPDANQLLIAFTRTDGMTNTPIQSLKWTAGIPCAYPEQKPWYDITGS